MSNSFCFWLFLAQTKVLSSRGPGVPLLLNPPHNLSYSAPPTPPVTQLWPCAAHENSHQIILTKHQHLLLGDTLFITHTCKHTNLHIEGQLCLESLVHTGYVCIYCTEAKKAQLLCWQ